MHFLSYKNFNIVKRLQNTHISFQASSLPVHHQLAFAAWAPGLPAYRQAGMPDSLLIVNYGGSLDFQVISAEAELT